MSEINEEVKNEEVNDQVVEEKAPETPATKVEVVVKKSKKGLITGIILALVLIGLVIILSPRKSTPTAGVAEYKAIAYKVTTYSIEDKSYTGDKWEGWALEIFGKEVHNDFAEYEGAKK